jgi:hypothetical protein
MKITRRQLRRLIETAVLSEAVQNLDLKFQGYDNKDPTVADANKKLSALLDDLKPDEFVSRLVNAIDKRGSKQSLGAVRLDKDPFVFFISKNKEEQKSNLDKIKKAFSKAHPGNRSMNSIQIDSSNLKPSDVPKRPKPVSKLDQVISDVEQLKADVAKLKK